MQGNGEILVSIIIPMYNVEKYIGECLGSLLNQTYGNLEIICVNDGSTDATLDIVLDVAKDDPRIRVVNRKNGGLSEARNTGMDEATGKYIYFLDADDTLQADAMEILVKCAEESGLQVVFFNAETVFESNEAEEKNRNYGEYYKRNGKYEGIHTGEELFITFIQNWDFKPSACLVFMNRLFLQEIGLRFYAGIYHEDNLFTIRLMQMAEKCMLCNKTLYRRLIREASIVSGEKNVKHAYGFFVCHREIMKAYGQQRHTYAYYNALRKYLKSMQNQAVNAVADREYDYLVEQIGLIEAEDTGAFLEYIETAFVKGKSKRRVSHSKQSTHTGKAPKKKTPKKKTQSSQWKRKVRDLKKRFDRNANKLKKACGKRIPKKVKWFFEVMVTKGPGYFVYRKKLKRQKDKIYVSIVMPVYNAERFLEETLESLVCQNLPNIEIICVDDGSTDGSLEILRKYSVRDSRIIILTQENQGAGVARNRGLDVSRGEYLLFLDADDIFHESMCNQVYYQCVKKKADICLFGARRMNMETLETEPMDWVLQRRLLPGNKVFSGGDVSQKLFQLTTGCPWNKMFRREFVLQSGIRFQNLQNANDAFFVRMHMALAKRITVLNDRFVTYRFNSGSNIQSNKSKAPFAFYEAFRAIKEELESRGMYPEFEQTYCNMVLKESLFNMRTTGDDTTRQNIKIRLLTEIFPYFGVMEHGEEFYYNKNEYQEMKELS